MLFQKALLQHSRRCGAGLFGCCGLAVGAVESGGGRCLHLRAERLLLSFKALDLLPRSTMVCSTLHRQVFAVVLGRECTVGAALAVEEVAGGIRSLRSLFSVLNSHTIIILLSISEVPAFFKLVNRRTLIGLGGCRHFRNVSIVVENPEWNSSL